MRNRGCSCGFGFPALLTAAVWMCGCRGPSAHLCSVGEGPEGGPAGTVDAPCLVPWPRSVDCRAGGLTLTRDTRIVTADARLAPLAGILADEIWRSSGLKPATAQGEGRPGDIVLLLSSALDGEAHEVEIADRAVVRAGTYGGVAMGTVALLQALRANGNGAAALPGLFIRDAPGSAFRGAQVCIKHQPHRLETLREAVDLCRLYKLNYLFFHVGGYQQLWLLCPPFRDNPLPKGGGDGGATISPEEMRDLIRYADERGVTIIGAAGAKAFAGEGRRWLFKAMPEFFAKHADFDERTQTLLDVPEYWAAVDELARRSAAMFASSPYLHLGAIDGETEPFGRNDAERDFMRRNGLRDSGDAWAYLLKRYDEIVKRHGKRSLVYEGVNRESVRRVGVPRDVVFLEYQSIYYRPMDVVEDGYPIVNFSWQPLYVAGRGAPLADVYAWDLRRWQNNWFRIREWRVPAGRPILGAMVGTWEGSDEASIPALRRRAAAMSERIWNPDAGRAYADFLRRVEHTDGLVQRLFYPANVAISGVADAPCMDAHEAVRYGNDVSITAAPVLPGTVHYTLDGSQPSPQSPRYEAPLTLRPTGFQAALFAEDGRQIGDVYARRLEHHPIIVHTAGLVPDWWRTKQPWWEPPRVFGDSVTVTLSSATPGLTVHYRLGRDPKPLTAEDSRADRPLTFTNETRLRAQCFDAQGLAQGAGYDVTYVNYGYAPNPLTGGATSSGAPGEPGQPDPEGAFAIDGSVERDTYWGAEAPRWLMVTLPSPRRFDGLDVVTYWDGGRYYQFTVEGSLDGTQWQMLIDRRANTEAATQGGYRDRFEPVDVRFLRVTMFKNSANIGVHIVELRPHVAEQPGRRQL